MIFTAIFAMLASMLGGLLFVVFPTLPTNGGVSFATIFMQGLNLVKSGVNFVWLLVEKEYVKSLCMWWLGFVSIIFTVELAIEIWRAITGNFGGQDVTTEMDITYNNDDGTTSTVHKTVHGKSKSHRRLPRI